MLPKNSKHYIVPTAEELNLPVDLVESVVSFYYNSVRKALTNLKCQNIVLENLGTFKAKKKELPKLIQKHERHLAVLNKETFNQMVLKKEIEERLAKVVSLKQRIEESDARKKQFFKDKKDGKL